MLTPTTLLAIGLALLGAHWAPDPALRLRALAALIAAAALAVYSFRGAVRVWPRPPRPEPFANPRARVARISGALWLAAGLALVAWALRDIWTQPFLWNQAWRWLLGLILALIGSYLIGEESGGEEERKQKAAERRGESEKKRGEKGEKKGGAEAELLASRWWQGAFLIAILIGAVWLRTTQLRTMPPGIFIDETNAALDGLRILEGRPDSLFGTGWFETPNGFVYLQTLFFRLLGTTFFAIKLQSLLPGILTVLALFFLTRELFGPSPALLATAFLAFNRWHINMSRWGWNEVYPPLMQVLTLFFIQRAARRRSLGDWAMAGFALGLGMYTYLAIRLVALAIGLYLLYRILVERGFLRRQWRGLLLFGLFYLLTFAPLAFTYAKDPFTFLNRSQQVSILRDVENAGGSWRPLRESISSHLQMFLVAGDRNPRHNLPGAPMLDPITGAFFLLGLAWAIWRWRDHRRGLLIIWVGTGLLGGILSRLAEAPQAYRTLAVVPAVAILAADAYDLSLRGLLHSWRHIRGGRGLVGLIASAGLLAAAWLNYDLYFHKQARDPSVYAAFTPLENAVAREVLAKRDDHRLYLSPRLYYFSPLRFFTYQPTRPVGVDLGPLHYSPFPQLGGGLDKPGYQLADPALDLPLPDLGGENALFLLDTHFQYVLDLFRHFYPGIQAELVNDHLGRPLYLSVTIPGHEISALQAHNNPEEITLIQGLYIPRTGEYALSAPGDAMLTLDGEIIDASPRTLGKGLHAFTISNIPLDLCPKQGVIAWQGPELSGPIPDANLFRIAPSGHGLQGTYHPNSDWTPPPFMQRVDPLLLTAWPPAEPRPGPFSVIWTGTLQVPRAGLYNFLLNADDGVRFWLDDKMIAESLIPDAANNIRATLDLSPGPHPVRIDYFQRGGGKVIEFFWQPPGDPMQPVAPRFLTPSH